ncbi:hypothetical protein D9757_014728 [Collybiopsis confluens]|uniref:Uncharacterized protein n=1 Tax=Collybiopsis confluens TaxID=2823264 RepID=A0A8H5FTN4_9AGAR|nr:hypothetical protein D9757_014728 [Collybiopsis confluens]
MRGPKRKAPTIPAGQILLSHLTELVVEPVDMQTDNLHGINNFLDSISCPSLKSLSIASLEVFEKTIQALERRSNFHLKHWEFISPHLSITTIMNTDAIETIVASSLSWDRDTTQKIRSPYKSLTLSKLTVSTTPTDAPAQESASVSDLNHSSSSEAISSSITIPCPRLQRLELRLLDHIYLSSRPQQLDLDEWDKVVEKVFECVTSRTDSFSQGGSSSGLDVDVSPLEVLLRVPDGFTERICHHKRFSELRTLGLQLNIIGR